MTAGVLALLALFGLIWDASSQGQAPASLIAAEPEPNALLTSAPERISLTFAEPIDPRSSKIRLLGPDGEDAKVGAVEVTAAATTRLTARSMGPLGAGGYTVVWSAQAARDGDLLTGAYPFRIGVAQNPGAAQLAGAWPELWAIVPRWLVFLGASLAAGGFAWARLLASGPAGGAPSRPIRIEVMTLGALVALLATALPFLLYRYLAPVTDELPSLAQLLWAMPLGWWLQIVALFSLALICLGVLASGRSAAQVPVAVDWLGLSLGLAALVGLSFTSSTLAQTSRPNWDVVALEIAHQWSTALWLSGLLYVAAGWRRLGSDVAHFRSVRWIGGVLLALSIIAGLARALPRFPSLGALLTDRYGQVLAAKGIFVLVILVLGFVVMVAPRRSTAARTSGSLPVQGAFALLAILLAAVLALMARPGTITRATLAGVELADVVPVDRAALSAETGDAIIHLLTQPASPGVQTLVVRITDGDGRALTLASSPTVEVSWTSFSTDQGRARAEVASPIETTVLEPDPSGALFTGAAMTPAAGWWQADVTVTPPSGIASRARFWLVLPDPNVTGRGPDSSTDPEARALFERGLESLTSLRSVRYTQRLSDGGGSLYRSQSAVSASDAERPATYTDVVINADGNVVAQQIIIADRRWILVGQDWVVAEPISFLTPAAWGEAYADANGFQFGPREEVNGELSQVVTFWQPPRADPSRPPAWFAWWIGLASGEVRREAMVSNRHYMVSEYTDFDVPLGITAPTVASPSGTPVTLPAPSRATPTAVEATNS